MGPWKKQEQLLKRAAEQLNGGSMGGGVRVLPGGGVSFFADTTGTSTITSGGSGGAGGAGVCGGNGGGVYSPGYSRTSRFDYWARLYEDACRTLQSDGIRQYYQKQMEIEFERLRKETGGVGVMGGTFYDDAQAAVRRDAIQRVRDSGIFEPPPVAELPPAEPKDELNDRFKALAEEFE